MDDLDERLRGIDRLSPPDLWAEARIRAGARPLSSTTLPPSPVKRLAVIVFAFAVAALGVGLVVVALGRGEGATPAAQSPSSPASTTAPVASTTVRVPDLAGLSYAEARVILADLGLEASPLYLANDGIPAGQVDHTRPEPGADVEAGTTVIMFLSAGPDGGGFEWAGGIVREHPGVFVGSYRGPDSFPVFAIASHADVASWQATLEEDATGRPFTLVQCPVDPGTLHAAEAELLRMVDGGEVQGVFGFGVDPRTCSLLIEGRLSASSIVFLRARFGDLVTIVDGVEPARILMPA